MSDGERRSRDRIGEVLGWLLIWCREISVAVVSVVFAVVALDFRMWWAPLLIALAAMARIVLSEWRRTVDLAVHRELQRRERERRTAQVGAAVRAGAVRIDRRALGPAVGSDASALDMELAE